MSLIMLSTEGQLLQKDQHSDITQKYGLLQQWMQTVNSALMTCRYTSCLMHRQAWVNRESVLHQA